MIIKKKKKKKKKNKLVIFKLFKIILKNKYN